MRSATPSRSRISIALYTRTTSANDSASRFASFNWLAIYNNNSFNKKISERERKKTRNNNNIHDAFWWQQEPKMQHRHDSKVLQLSTHPTTTHIATSSTSSTTTKITIFFNKIILKNCYSLANVELVWWAMMAIALDIVEQHFVYSWNKINNKHNKKSEFTLQEKHGISKFGQDDRVCVMQHCSCCNMAHTIA